jgi:hypothetical protein
MRVEQVRFRSGAVPTDSLEWLAMRTVLLDIDFTVESPLELHEIVGRFAERLDRSRPRLRP